MNNRFAPIPEMCIHYLKEIKHNRVDKEQWLKAFRRRGIPQDLIGSPQTIEDLIVSIERIKKEYTING